MFSKYVGFEAVHRATFNYWEPSLTIEKDGKRFLVYHTKYPVNPLPNLVVLESMENSEEIYFRAFLGKHSGECKTAEESKNYFEELRKTVSPEFRVMGVDLEKIILETLDKIDKGQFPRY